MSWMKKYSQEEERGYCRNCKKIVEPDFRDQCPECEEDLMTEFDQAWCEDCEEVVYMSYADGQDPACEYCDGGDIYINGDLHNAKCTECMEEWSTKTPDGDCGYCGEKGSVIYGTKEELDAYGPDSPSEVFKLIEKNFGTTGNMACAGWILPNGSIINACSGQSRGRDIDHREVDRFMGKYADPEDVTVSMHNLIRMGGIRLQTSSHTPSIQFVGNPNSSQMNAIGKFFEAFPNASGYGVQAGLTGDGYKEFDNYWDAEEYISSTMFPTSAESDLELRLSKYAISLPRGYYDGLKEALRAMEGEMTRVARISVDTGGDATDASAAIERLVYDQLAKKMGFEDVEVVEAFGNGRTASVTVFNPQTDEASEIEITIGSKCTFAISDVAHEIDTVDVLQKSASMNKEAISVKKIVRQRKYKHGYIIRDEYWALEDDDPEDEWTLMERMAYTPCGEYIGDSKDAYFLCKTMGIIPRVSSPDHTVCSIGYNPIEKKWYGWSHRAIAGFGIGDMIFDPEFGDDHTPFRRHGDKKIEKMEDAMRAAVAFANYVS